MCCLCHEPTRLTMERMTTTITFSTATTNHDDRLGRSSTSAGQRSWLRLARVVSDLVRDHVGFTPSLSDQALTDMPAARWHNR